MQYLASIVVVATFTLTNLQAKADEKTVLIDQAVVQSAGGFPYIITKPGKYSLNGNLHVPANSNGIVVEADNVVLNLSGFELECLGGQNTGILSDFSTTSYSNITVAGGNVAGCWTGVDLSGTNNATVDGLTVSRYGVMAIEINVGAIRKNTVTGGSDPHSTGLALSSGIVDSNLVLNDYIGISIYGSDVALVLGNLVTVQYSAIFSESVQPFLAGSNTLINYSSAFPLGGAVSQNNNLCNRTAC